MLGRLFQLEANKTSVGKEVIAGLTTFLTMAYIVFVNPKVLHASGMDLNAVFVATCLVAALGSLLISFLANYPIAVAPGMALNVYFTYVIVQGMNYSWQAALGAVFVSGLLFIAITLSPIRRRLVESIPKSLTIGISVGIGIFIAILGLTSAEIVKANPSTLMTLGNVASTKSLLFFLGFVLIVVLEHWRVRAAILISILLVSIIALFLGLTQFNGLLAWPTGLSSTFLQLDVAAIWNWHGASIILAFLLVALFDATGTTLGLLHQPLFTKDPQRSQRISRALLAASVSTTAGALLGTSSTSPFVESAAGIREGGRTGLTALVVALLFLLSLFFAPLAATVPSFAVAPALLYVGLLMASHIRQLDSSDFTELLPCLLTALMIPFSFSIADGIGLGILSYVSFNVLTGQFKRLNSMLWLLAVVFLTYFVFKP